jgi:hypothetical protein
MGTDSLAAQMVRGVVESYSEGLEAGLASGDRKLLAIHAAYVLALKDQGAKLPSYLMAAIEASRGKSSESAKIEKQRGVSSTEYRITGNLPEVFGEIDALFTNFPTPGYGTFVHGIAMQDDGRFSARVSHMNSCD